MVIFAECGNIRAQREAIKKVRWILHEHAHQDSIPYPVPPIVKVDGVCGGQAIIEGTRIAVWHIVGYYYKVGMSVEEILAEWAYLMPAQVFSALAYYHDNREEIDRVRHPNSYAYWQEHYAPA